MLALPGGSGLTPNPAILGLLRTHSRISNQRTCGGNDDGDVDALMVLTRMVITDPTAYTAGKKHMGQFLQGGKNGRLMSFFLKVEPPCDQT